MTAPIDPCPHPTASRIRRVGQEECGACGAKREPSAKAYYGWDEWRTASAPLPPLPFDADDRPPGEQLAERVWPDLAALPAEQRAVFFETLTGNWCASCGNEHPGNHMCQCERDE